MCLGALLFVLFDVWMLKYVNGSYICLILDIKLSVFILYIRSIREKVVPLHPEKANYGLAARDRSIITY